MKRVALMLLLLGSGCTLLAACNTIEGIGKDVKEAGEEVEETAEGR